MDIYYYKFIYYFYKIKISVNFQAKEILHKTSFKVLQTIYIWASGLFRDSTLVYIKYSVSDVIGLLKVLRIKNSINLKDGEIDACRASNFLLLTKKSNLKWYFRSRLTRSV